MNTRKNPPRPRRRVLRAFAVALATLAVGSAAAVVAPVAASAAPVSAVDDVQITNAPPYATYAPYTVDATWSVPDSAASGDTFTLDFPDELSGYTSNFTLLDAGGATVGTCDVTSSQFLCTLGAYVDTHTNVHGSLHFQAQFTKTTPEEDVVFTADNAVTFAVPTPGGVVDGGGDVPQKPSKWGSMNADGHSMTWVISVPGEYLVPVDGVPATIVDHYDPALAFDASKSYARWGLDADYSASIWHAVTAGSGAGTYTLAEDAANHTFSVTFNEPVTDPDRLYQFVTQMELPTSVENGDVFNNSIDVAGRTVTARPVQYTGSGGDGDGGAVGGLALTKDVTGTGTTRVAGTAYTVSYSYSIDGAASSGTLTVQDGETDGLDGLPEGTVVTLAEVKATGTGVTYGTPKFTGTGVTDNKDGTATLTITDDTVAVALENPVTTNLGDFDVTKDVTGTGAAQVAGTTYTVDYSYDLDGTATSGSLALKEGETDGLDGLPEGTVVTLAEVKATGTGVTYGTPKFTGTGVTDNKDGTATLTITDDTVAVELENPVTTIPPVTPPHTPASASLAITGADSAPLIALGAVIVGTGLVLLVAGLRRKRA